MRSILLVLWLLLAAMPTAGAAELSLSAGGTAFRPGDELSLSAGIAPGADAGTPADLYVAAILPDGTLLTLGDDFAWHSAPTPLLAGLPLAALNAPGFYVMRLPAGLPVGEYVFAAVAVPAGTDPLDGGNWLGIATASVSFADDDAGVTLATVGAACQVGVACDVPLVAGVSGGSPPYHFQQDSFAYGLRPLNTNIDLLTGNLVGTPGQAGSYTFNICAVDLGGNQDCKPVTVVVADAAETARVYLGGDVATLATVALDGTLIKDTNSANLSTYVDLAAGAHTLAITCTSTYCFAYLEIEAPSGYAITPTTISLTPDALPPGTTRTYTLNLSR